MRAGNARRRGSLSFPHPSVKCSSCYPFAFPWPLERLARILCPRNEDHKLSRTDGHSRTPVLPLSLPGQSAATYQGRGSFVYLGQRGWAGLCHSPTFYLHRAVIATRATELFAHYTQPRCGCCCPLSGCSSSGFGWISGVMRTGCSRHPLLPSTCC